jgi:hypothetical protein
MEKQHLQRPTTLRIENELKIWLIREANKENRTISNLINTILKAHKEEKEKVQ